MVPDSNGGASVNTIMVSLLRRWRHPVGFFSFVWRRNRIVQFFRPLLVKVLVEVGHDDDSIEIES